LSRQIHEPPWSKPRKRQGLLRFWLKLTITLGLFGVLFSRIDLERCAAALARANGWWLAAAFVACSIAFVTSTLRWHRLLRALGGRVSRRALLQAYGIGHFASAFLPGTVGGDVLRLRLVGPIADGYLPTGASILAERAIGLFALVVAAAVSVFVNRARFATPPLLVLICGALALVTVTTVLALNRRASTSAMYRWRRSRLGRPLKTLYRLQRMLHRIPPGAVVAALGWSFAFYLGSALLLYCSCAAYGIPLTYPQAASVVVVVSLIMLIPISLGGLGLRQAGDVYMLGLLGIDPAHAIVASLTRQLVNSTYALIGGGLFVAWRGRVEPRQGTPRVEPSPVPRGNRGPVAVGAAADEP
jgi:uncharacterized protein (TIRG00374 family)